MSPSPSSSTTDPQTLARLEQLLKDPVAGPKLMAILNQPNTGMLGNVASAVSKQQTPSGQVGAGLGAAIGTGLQSLLKKPTPPSGMAGRNPNSPGVDSAVRASSGPGDGSDDDDYDDEMTPEFAKGGEVKGGEPKHGVHPVVSIIIAAAKEPEKGEPEKKDKSEKKRAGGSIKARKPKAIPPKHGPTPHGPPTPFAKGGRVQAPRGAGCAERGKQFRGIF